MAASKNNMFRKLLYTAVSISGAVKQTWHARKILVNPIETFKFFFISPFRKLEQASLFRFQEMRLYARSSDWYAVDEVILRGEYKEVLSILNGMTRPLVVDLGANIGTFSMQVFLINCNAIIHAVEPSLATYQILEKNRKINPSFNWYAHQYALWNHDGTIGFEENTQASTGSHLGNSAQSVYVPSIRLKTLVERFIDRPIDLIKMDIEGAEETVLFDSLDILSNTKTLILEIHPHRCNETKIRRLLHNIYPYVYEISGRLSSKPLLFASQTDIALKQAKKLVV